MTGLLGGSAIAAAFTATARKVADVAAQLTGLVPATVLSDFTAAGETLVGLDSAPGTPVPARSLAGLYGRNDRVLCLVVPPRGLYVLGPLSGRGDAGLTLDRLVVPGLRGLDVFDGAVRTTAVTTDPGYADAGTVAALTVPWPRSGSMLVSWSGRLYNTTAVNADAVCLGFQIRNGTAAGAVLLAATDDLAIVVRGQGSTTPSTWSKTVIVKTSDLTGAPASGNAYVRAMLRTSNAGNAANALAVTLCAVPQL